MSCHSFSPADPLKRGLAFGNIKKIDVIDALVLKVARVSTSRYPINPSYILWSLTLITQDSHA